MDPPLSQPEEAKRVPLWQRNRRRGYKNTRMPLTDLGELQETCAVSRRFLGSALLLFTLTLSGCFFLLNRLYTPASIRRQDRKAAAIACGLCGISSLLIAFVLIQRRGTKLKFYSEGLELEMPGKDCRFRWDEVQNLALKVTSRSVNGVRANTLHEYTLHLSDGRKVTIPPGMQDLEKLGERLEREVYPRAAKRAFELLRRNQAVIFGPCKISNRGLEMSGTLKAWTELEPITLSGGVFTVRKLGGQTWRVVPFAEIPNAPIFLQLTQSLRKA